MTKIVLSKGCALPKGRHAAGRIWENARGGPYKYGVPIHVNAESLARLHSGKL